MNPIHFVFSTTFSLSLAGLMLNRLHFLSTLLCLEGMMLSLFLAFSMWALHMDFCNLAMIPMLLLAFSACEASTGLALLVATARTHGSDLLRNFNLLKC